MQYFNLPLSQLLRFWSILNDILEAKGNHFADILARSAALKGTSSSQNSVTGQRKLVVTQSCLTLFNPMGWSPPGSLVHGILQTRILEWVSVSFSRGSSQPRNWTQVSCVAGGVFTIWATGEALFPQMITEKLTRGTSQAWSLVRELSFHMPQSN